MSAFFVPHLAWHFHEMFCASRRSKCSSPASLSAHTMLRRSVWLTGSQITSKPRAAVAMEKEFFNRQSELGIAAAYDAASQIMACNMMDEAALEGVQAFIEKRPPRWNKQ